MNRPAATCARRHPGSAVAWSAALAVILFAAGATTPAFAGLGKLVKDRATQALQKPAAAAARPADDVEFTDELLELNDARVTGVLAALKAGRAATPDRAAMLASRTRMQDEIGALSEKHGRAMDAAQDRRNRSADCWSEQLGRLTSAREKTLQEQMMSDPAARNRMLGLATRLAQAQANGDTAAVRALQTELLGQAAATHADSLLVKQRCGEPVPVHPMQVRIDSLQAAVSNIDHRLHDADEAALDAQIKASGQNGPQLAMSKERILMYLAAVKSKQAPRGFTAAELKTLDARRSELLAAFAPYMD
jgi:hypothetical protein